MQGRSKYSESLHEMFLNRFKGRLSTIGKNGQIANILSASKPIQPSIKTYDEIYPRKLPPQSTPGLTNSSLRRQAAHEGEFKFISVPFKQIVHRSIYWQNGLVPRYRTSKRRYIKPPERERIRNAGHMQVTSNSNCKEYFNTSPERARFIKRRHFSTPKNHCYKDFNCYKYTQGSYWYD